jgi:alcohol dehydrogenase class IV
MHSLHTFSFPTAISYGVGARFALGPCLQSLGKRRVLLVTDGALQHLPPVQEIARLLHAANLEPTVFAEVSGHPDAAQVHAGAQAYAAARCDALVLVGGGAALDVGKCIALLAHHSGPLFDYAQPTEQLRAGPCRQVVGPMPPVVALPTTAGTGSEVGRSSVISDSVTAAKRIIFHPRLLPTQVLLDPFLCLGVPKHITAATGMDALTHLVESYLSLGVHPLCDGIALQGLGLVARNLQACVDFAAAAETSATPLAGPSAGLDTSDAHLAARGTMQLAALMGGVAFQKGLGVTHSCAHALSTVCGLHHGLANSLMLPQALRFNLAQVPQPFVALAHAAGLPAARDAAASGEQFIKWVGTLRSRLGLPSSLAAVGVRPEHVPALVACAQQDGCHANNPRRVLPADFERLFLDAMGQA